MTDLQLRTYHLVLKADSPLLYRSVMLRDYNKSVEIDFQTCNEVIDFSKYPASLKHKLKLKEDEVQMQSVHIRQPRLLIVTVYYKPQQDSKPDMQTLHLF